MELEYLHCGYGVYLDLQGVPVKRTKENYPYNYDRFVVWKGAYNEEKSKSAFSDRLMQWHYDKFNECCEAVWGNTGQYFHDRTPKDIERFLSMYLGKEVKLTLIMECCNVSNGYPYWYFCYEDINN